MRRHFFMVVAALAGPALAAPPVDTGQRIRQFEQGFVPPVMVAGEKPELKSLSGRMAELKVPGLSIAVIHQGRIGGHVATA